MSDTLEVRPHPDGEWGVFHIAKNQFIAVYPRAEDAYRYAFGYLNEHIRNLKTDIERLTSTR